VSSILIRITSGELATDRFRYYEVYANQTDIPDPEDVEAGAEFNALELGNYFPHVGLEPGSTWYHWVRAVYDDGTRKSDYLKFGPTTAPSGASITAASITDASANGRSLIMAADYAAMRTLLGITAALVFKGALDCSANPNYPAADAGHVYKVSVAGRVGGGSGPNVEIGDSLYCTADGTASGSHATVGANWVIVQNNLDGAVIGPASVTDGHFALFDGTTGKLIKAASVSTVLNALGLVTCQFGSRRGADQVNFAGDSAYYTVICDSALYDIGGGYDTSTGIFTVPTGAGGLWHFDGVVSLNNLAANHTEAVLLFAINGTSAGRYGGRCNPYGSQASSGIGKDISQGFDVILSDGDTVRMRLYLGGSGAGKTVTLQAASSTVNAYTAFSGHRVGPAS